MSVLKISDMVAALRKKGFNSVDKSGKHIVLRFVYKGRITPITTHYSHGDTEIGDTLIKFMANQVRLSKADFCKFVKCDISEEEYIEIVGLSDENS